jgi:ubiquinone/menaquinone biosynthesis C-methylase UbiE
MLEWTGERFLPWIEGAQIHYEHLHRYAFASQFVKGKRVIDLACGEGYGTYMLASEAEYVAGVEIDKPTVQHARSRYIKDNLEFIEGSILAVPIEGEMKFDVVVCFEAIEHIAEHDKLLSEVKRLLTDDGLFIASTPNKAVYTDAPNFHNPFHIKELQFDEFQGLLKRYFKHVHIYGQRVYAGSSIWSADEDEQRGYLERVVKRGDTEFYFAERISKEPVYLIALASNAGLEPLTSITDSWLTDASNALFNDYERRLAELKASLQEKASQIHSLQSQIHSLESQMQQMQQSIPMQLAKPFQQALDGVAPPGTRRRRLCELVLTGTRLILNEGWTGFFRAVHEYLRRPGKGTTKGKDE